MTFDELMEVLTGDGDKPDTIYDDIRNSYADVQRQLSDSVASSDELSAALAEKDERIKGLEADNSRLKASNDDLFSKIPSDDGDDEDDEISGIDDLFDDDEDKNDGC